MAYRTLEITLISARDLKNVNTFSKMDVYAVATLDGDARSRQRTSTDSVGGTNPSWNATFRFQIPSNSDLSRHVLHVLLRAERVLGDRDVGEVHIPLKDLVLSNGDAGMNSQFLSYQVRKTSSGKPMGVLNLSYKLIDGASAPMSAPPPAQPTKIHDYTSPAAAYPPPASKISDPYPATAYPAVAAYPPPAKASKADYSAGGSSAPYPPPGKAFKADEPVTAYPAAATAYPSGGAAYPPPPPAYGYGAPPQQAYGYGAPPPPRPYGYGAPPPQYGYPPAGGYGYGAVPPQQQQPPRKNNMGLGLGAGLLGGALGGLLIGDMIGDASGYDAGYDAGFDDGGGFDF